LKINTSILIAGMLKTVKRVSTKINQKNHHFMTTTIKRLHRHFLLATAILSIAIFIMGCSSTTNLSSTNAKMKGLKFVKATPANVNTNVVVASSPTRSFNTPSELAQPTVITASTDNGLVLSTLSQNNIQIPSVQVDKDVIIAPQSTAKVAVVKATTTKAKNTKPKSNKTKMILLGILAYIALGGALKTAVGYKNAKTNGGGCKSWLAAFLLCTFLGDLGIHRFYLGYTWQGIVQLLTGGGCGLWAFIDWIRIITKSLEPKDGDYC
jgi:hypothetical protein